MNLLTNEISQIDSIFEKMDELFVNGTKSGIIAIVVNLIISIILKKITDKLIEKTDFKQKAMIIKVKNIVINTLLVLGILYQFTFMGNLITTLLASGGIVAVVVGLASQEAASNIVSGLMILASKPFNIGDTIILKDQGLRGTVIDMNMNHTVIENVDKNPIMIPNTVMNKAIVENITQDTDFKITYIYVDVSYECDLDKAISIMQDVIEKHPLFYDQTLTAEEIKVPVHCMEFKDSGISLRAKVTTRSASDGFELSSDCRMEIKREFDKNDIEIPYPHVQIKQ